MSKITTVIEGTGLLILWVGMAAMDSENVVIPISMMLVGLALMFSGASMEEKR